MEERISAQRKIGAERLESAQQQVGQSCLCPVFRTDRCVPFINDTTPRNLFYYKSLLSLLSLLQYSLGREGDASLTSLNASQILAGGFSGAPFE